MKRRFCVNVQVKMHLTQIPPKWQSAVAAMVILGGIITVTAPTCLAVVLLLA